MMPHDSLNKTMIKGFVIGKRRRGRHSKNWLANIHSGMGGIRNGSDSSTRGYSEPWRMEMNLFCTDTSSPYRGIVYDKPVKGLSK